MCKVGAVLTVTALVASEATVGLAQSVPSAAIARCEQLVQFQADAFRNPSVESRLILTGPNGTKLVYLGVGHTFDPADPQFDVIEKEWEELQPTEAFYEGRPATDQPSIAAAITASGEPGLVRYLARKGRVPAHSLEPTREAEVEELAKHFTTEQLLVFFVMRSVVADRDRRRLSPGELEPVFAQYLAREHGVRAFANVLPDLIAFRSAYSQWFPKMDPTAAPANWFDPTRTSAEMGSVFLNDVNRASSAFRDTHMYRLLAHALKPGARLFAAVGRAHVPAQAAALRCAME